MKQVKSLFRRAKAHKIKDVDLARVSGRHVSTFQLWKTGKSSPTMDVFDGVEDALERLIAEKGTDETSTGPLPTDGPNQDIQDIGGNDPPPRNSEPEKAGAG